MKKSAQEMKDSHVVLDDDAVKWVGTRDECYAFVAGRNGVGRVHEIFDNDVREWQLRRAVRWLYVELPPSTRLARLAHFMSSLPWRVTGDGPKVSPDQVEFVLKFLTKWGLLNLSDSE